MFVLHLMHGESISVWGIVKCMTDNCRRISLPNEREIEREICEVRMLVLPSSGSLVKTRFTWRSSKMIYCWYHTFEIMWAELVKRTTSTCLALGRYDMEYIRWPDVPVLHLARVPSFFLKVPVFIETPKLPCFRQIQLKEWMSSFERKRSEKQNSMPLSKNL